MSSTKGDIKVCSVCGDKAFGFNFNAITCESCKAFFRRNAVKKKEFHCAFNSSCKINVVTRRFCQKCRLQKCVEVGMKKDLILTEEQKNMKRRKLPQQKRAKKLNAVQTDCNFQMTSQSETDQLTPWIETCCSYQIYGEHKHREVETNGILTPDLSPIMTAEFIPEDPDHDIKSLTRYLSEPIKPDPDGRKHAAVQTARHKVETTDAAVQVNMTLKNSEKSMFGAIMNNAIECELQLHISGTDSITPLTSSELARLEELKNANLVWNVPLDEEPLILQNLDSRMSLINVVNVADIAIRRIIKMVKLIQPFKRLCAEDQVSMLKEGCIEILSLRSVMFYDQELDSWKLPQPSTLHIKVAVLKEARGNFYEDHIKFISRFPLSWRIDLNLMLLLEAIVLFTPTRRILTQRQKIKEEQDAYLCLLNRYLLNLLGKQMGNEAYNRLLENLQALQNMHTLFTDNVLDVNPMEVKPLVLEIFGL